MARSGSNTFGADDIPPSSCLHHSQQSPHGPPARFRSQEASPTYNVIILFLYPLSSRLIHKTFQNLPDFVTAIRLVRQRARRASERLLQWESTLMERHSSAVQLLQDLDVSIAGLSGALSKGLPENVSEPPPPQPWSHWHPEESPEYEAL